MNLEDQKRIQAYRTSLRSDCFISLPFCRTWVALKSSGTLNARAGEEGERAGLALVTPCWFTKVQRQALDDKRPVGRSVGRLGPYRPIARRGHYSLRSGGICVELWQLKNSCYRSWRSFDSRHCCPGDGPSVPRSTKEPALTR
jgi:hypothetical protein